MTAVGVFKAFTPASSMHRSASTLALRSDHVDQVAHRLRLQFHHPKIAIETVLLLQKRFHGPRFRTFEPQFELPLCPHLVILGKALRRGSVEIFKPATQPLADEDSPCGLRTLALHSREISRREDTADKGGNEYIGFQAHEVIYRGARS